MGEGGVIYLLDTSIYSQPLKRNRILPALERWQEVGDHRCRISRVTIAEVEWGLHYEDSERRWRSYRDDLQGTIEILPTDDAVWTAFAKMRAAQVKIGQPVTLLDLLIAATARVHDLTVATLNARDFSRIQGIRWEDWSV
jgi:tRNA(fMet)-specific endonuclease VapC